MTSQSVSLTGGFSGEGTSATLPYNLSVKTHLGMTMQLENFIRAGQLHVRPSDRLRLDGIGPVGLISGAPQFDSHSCRGVDGAEFSAQIWITKFARLKIFARNFELDCFGDFEQGIGVWGMQKNFLIKIRSYYLTWTFSQFITPEPELCVCVLAYVLLHQTPIHSAVL